MHIKNTVTNFELQPALQIFSYVDMLYVILRLFYLFAILFPPWSEQSGGLVWAHTDDELPFRIPAQVLDCIKVTWYHHPRPPLSLVRQYWNWSVKNYQPLTSYLKFPSTYTSLSWLVWLATTWQRVIISYVLLSEKSISFETSELVINTFGFVLNFKFTFRCRRNWNAVISEPKLCLQTPHSFLGTPNKDTCKVCQIEWQTGDLVWLITLITVTHTVWECTRIESYFKHNYSASGKNVHFLLKCKK